MKAKSEPLILLLMVLVGAVVGSLIWSLVTPYLPEIFAKSITVGTTAAPVTLDLGVVTFTMGLILKVNIGAMLGMVTAFLIYRKM